VVPNTILCVVAVVSFTLSTASGFAAAKRARSVDLGFLEVSFVFPASTLLFTGGGTALDVAGVEGEGSYDSEV
jgi:hypothetical protein